MKVFMKLILPVGLIIAFSVSALASSSLVPVPVTDTGEAVLDAQATENIITEAEEPEPAFTFKEHYIYMTGKISEADLSNNRILVSGTKNGEIYYNLSKETLIYSLNSTERVSTASLTAGRTVSVFYNVMTPQALSLPPQVTPEVIVVHDNELAGFAKVDYFNENHVSSDNTLKLNLAEEMLIVGTDNKPRAFSETRSKNLLVFYNIATRSIPAQTPPIKVVVLDTAVLSVQAPGTVITEEATEPQPPENINTENTENLQAESILDQFEPEHIINRDGVRFIALYKLAEKLGYDLQWNAETSAITVIKPGESAGYTFKPEAEQFEYNGMTMTFGHAPFIVNSRTYVDEGFLDIIK